MKKKLFKSIFIFLVLIGAFYWILNFIFFNQNSPKSKAGGEIINVIFDPSSVNTSVDKEFTVTFKVKPSKDIALRGYRIRLVFDKTKLNLQKIVYKLGTVSKDLGDTDNNLTAINQIGLVSLIGESQAATGEILNSGSEKELAKLTFKVLTSAGSSFQISNSDVNFFAFDQDMVLFEVPLSNSVQFNLNGGGPLVTLSPNNQPLTPVTISPTNPSSVSGNVKLNLKLKFQGIGKLPVESLRQMNVKIKLKKEGAGTNVYETNGTLNSDSNGVWSGTVGINIADISGKWLFYIKGPHHIQKKICGSKPKENSPGTYRCSDGNITLVNGNNDFDFSGITFLVGDLDQSGVVDSVDFALVKNNLGKTDVDTLKKADLNRDGRVDTQDFSLILAALLIKTDEL